MTEIYIIVIEEFNNLHRRKVRSIVHDKIHWHPTPYQNVFFDELTNEFRISFLSRDSTHFVKMYVAMMACK